MKNTFIESEIWLLSRLGAFQRANIYKPEASDLQKRQFSFKLKGSLDNLIVSQYSKPVSEDQHIENIERLSDFSGAFDCTLKEGLNFGVSQKILNLYLKYQWCLGKIPTPPHFPVDSIIQKELRLPVTPWTKMKGEQGKADYMNIMEAAKLQLQENDCKNVAELELKLFRRNQ